uniref:Cation-transporting P-type ATPase C-terminal domain-containing protein n=1 Tax=Pseudictyota dubia TaxID=2749911 RepID=A0A7R9WJD6_9STRA
MRRPARDSAVDRLVTKKLVSFAYLQIGMIQAIAGFFTWFVVMNDYGYPPHILPGLGSFDNWGKQVLFCRFDGGQFRNLQGDIFPGLAASGPIQAQLQGFYFWDSGATGSIEECAFPARNFDGSSSSDESDALNILVASTYGRFTNSVAVVSAESITALRQAGYVEYYPWKGVESPFWVDDWLQWSQTRKGLQGTGTGVDDLLFFNVQLPGVWQIDTTVPAKGDPAEASQTVLDITERYFRGELLIPNGDEKFWHATFAQPAFGDAATEGSIRDLCYCERATDAVNAAGEPSGPIWVNVANRQMQKEALHHAQCAYFVTIVVVQWADLLICKTRWLSIYHQGMRNPAMNFGLLFETLLAAVLCYAPGIDLALGTRPLRLLHWVPAVPFSIVIFLYDEIRKYIMRATSVAVTQGQQVIMHYGWMARQTYY